MLWLRPLQNSQLATQCPLVITMASNGNWSRSISPNHHLYGLLLGLLSCWCYSVCWPAADCLTAVFVNCGKGVECFYPVSRKQNRLLPLYNPFRDPLPSLIEIRHTSLCRLSVLFSFMFADSHGRDMSPVIKNQPGSLVVVFDILIGRHKASQYCPVYWHLDRPPIKHKGLCRFVTPSILVIIT